MDYFLFAKAAAMGLLIAAPVGPIGLLCMQRTLSGGVKIGFFSGLGAATADAAYGAIGAFGLTAVVQFFTELSGLLGIFGALFLGWMGTKLLTTSTQQSSSAGSADMSPITAFTTTALLTIANPMTILSFVAVFATLSGSLGMTSAAAATMVLGVFSGSALWWLALSGFMSLIRHRIKQSGLDRISQGAGLLLLVFAAWQLQSSLF